MKKHCVISLLFILIVAAFFTEVTSSSIEPPTVSPSGYASAPTGFNNCTSCHSGTALNGGGNVGIAFSGANNQYQTSTAYTVTVTVTDAARSRFGFAAVSLNGAGTQAGSFTVTNSATTSLQQIGGPNGIQ